MRLSINKNVLLWVLQGYLALFFALGSGAPKLVLPLAMLPMPIPLPELFIRAIGVCEVLGALGLILPSIGRIQRLSVSVGLPIGPGLTRVAAACLTLLTICATVYQLLGGQPGSAVFAAITGVLCAVVYVGRGGTTRQPRSQVAHLGSLAA